MDERPGESGIGLANVALELSTNRYRIIFPKKTANDYRVLLAITKYTEDNHKRAAI